MMEDAGQKLKQTRERLGLTYREVEEYSGRIAEVRRNEEYSIALSRLADIENKGTVPSFYRLYTLCAIYRLDFNEVLAWYGISFLNLPADASLVRLAKTHRVGFQGDDEGEVQVPLAVDPGLDMSRTLFLSRFIQRWGKLPLLLMNGIDLRSHAYGLIGTEDWSMYPILSPGSLVVIDQTRRKIVNSGWASEFERPIYFVEHRDGYACGWCTLKESQLILQSHPASQQEPEAFDYPKQAEVVGQVTYAGVNLDPVVRRRTRG
jgi:transcriptional regulator with XRE-family HTH domain